MSALPLLLLPALVQPAPAVPPPTGPWSGAIELPGGALPLQVDFRNEGAWTGALSIPAQGLKGFPLADLKAEGSQVRFRLAGLPGDPAFRGQLQPDGSLKGTFTQGGQGFPLTLKPGALPTAPVPPAAPRSPEDREVVFPGFNGVALKGSVRAAQGHGHFAVLMAGSGPTDRDWSNPLIQDPRTGQRIPSHGGRDLAAWLATQGLGSLRWDKRFIGSQDPRLDISLDAQVGDLKAALAFARTLPEAKGKKLLLVGHSEGALLSLLAAQGADALLLLGLPGQTMAKTIEAHVGAQLPPEQAPANLAYLASVFQAVREDKPQPAPSAQVFPGLVQLGRSLMQSESLPFVKATLDLDPWPLAARVTVPLAAAWGDKDVQTPRPGLLPKGFPGTVIDLKDANHLLKREPRPRVDLSGPTAGAAYGDDTPLADLTPLATWLKQLK